MSRQDLVWSWAYVAVGVLLLTAGILRSAIAGTLLFFFPSPDGPTWVTVGIAVFTTIHAMWLWRHYRGRPKAEGGAL